MTTLAPPIQNQAVRPIYDLGVSPASKEVSRQLLKARDHYIAIPSLNSNIWKHVFGTSSLCKFEEEVEKIREGLISETLNLSITEMSLLKILIRSVKEPRILSLIKLLDPLLENDRHSENAAEIIRALLTDKRPAVRYASLESLGYALGETPLADVLLEDAKEILKDEKVSFVVDYLRSL